MINPETCAKKPDLLVGSLRKVALWRRMNLYGIYVKHHCKPAEVSLLYCYNRRKVKFSSAII